MDYLELTVKLTPRDPWTEVLMVELGDNGYESFVETEEGLQAYAQVGEIDPENPVKNTILGSAHAEFKAEWETKIIPQQNWNAVWKQISNQLK